LVQLRRENVKQRDGIPFIEVTDVGEGKSVKTSSSVRDVPLHPALVREGFLEFVATVPAGGFLFPIGGDNYERRADNASKTLMRWLRSDVVGIKDAKLNNYSWRHRMEDELREIDAPDGVAWAITGRAESGSRRLYGKTGRPSLKVLAGWIAKVPEVKLGKATEP
jgi:hypothetical protein